MPDGNQSLDQLISSLSELRAKNPNMALEARSDASPLIKDLDALYWKEVERIVTEVVGEGQDRLLFNKYHRMVIDAGLLDDRLLAGDQSGLKTALTKELYQESHRSQFYFSPWLVDRYKTYQFLGRSDPPQSAVPQLTATLPEVCNKLREARVKIYANLKPFFQNLPGLGPPMIESLVSGSMDLAIDEALTLGASAPVATRDRLEKMTEVRTVILAKAKDRCSSDRQLVLFDALRQVDEKMARELETVGKRAAAQVDESGRLSAALPLPERLKVILGDVKLLRNLIRLGTMGSGITRTHSVLLSSHARMTKDGLSAILSRVFELDPHLPGSPNVLIAPFCGTGFFEWDIGTIIVPLISIKAEDESVVNGLANYRILVDNLHHNGKLKRGYEAAFPGTDFRKGFIKDYKNWILGVGKGFRGSMEAGQYAFFKSNIGPSCDDLFAPAELVNLTPDERVSLVRACRKRINDNEDTFEDHYKLGVVYWKESRYQESLDQMARAVKINPTDGRAMFSLGFLCKKMAMRVEAKKALNEVGNISRNSLWHVYATEILAEF